MYPFNQKRERGCNFETLYPLSLFTFDGKRELTPLRALDERVNILLLLLLLLC